MNWSGGLALKVLGGLAVVGTAATVGVVYGVPKEEEKVEVPPKAPESPSFKDRAKEIRGRGGLEKLGFNDGGDGGQIMASSTSLDGQKLKELEFRDPRIGRMKAKGEIKGHMKFEMKETKDVDVFPEGVRIYMVNLSDEIVITGGEDNFEAKYTFKKGTNPEFRVSDGGLEPAWDMESLGRRIGLVCSRSERTCAPEEGKTMNVIEETRNRKTKAVSENVSFSGKLNYRGNVENCFQGFELTVDEDIDLKGAEEKEIKKLLKGKSYQIRIPEDEERGWNLFRVVD